MEHMAIQELNKKNNFKTLKMNSLNQRMFDELSPERQTAVIQQLPENVSIESSLGGSLIYQCLKAQLISGELILKEYLKEKEICQDEHRCQTIYEDR